MFFKKKNTNKEIGVEILDPKFQFQEALQFIDLIILDKSYSTQKKIMLLDYFSSVIKDDLQTNYSAMMFYQSKKTLRLNRLPFPTKIYDDHSNIICECIFNGFKEIDLSKDYVITLPWKDDNMIRQIIARKEDSFVFIPTNHRSYYYPCIDLCFVYNGIHSITAGKYHKQGTIMSQICDIEPLFKHIYTDGVKWYKLHNNSPISNLCDFRFGILFEIAKTKSQLLTSLNIQSNY